MQEVEILMILWFIFSLMIIWLSSKSMIQIYIQIYQSLIKGSVLECSEVACLIKNIWCNLKRDAATWKAKIISDLEAFTWYCTSF